MQGEATSTQDESGCWRSNRQFKDVINPLLWVGDPARQRRRPEESGPGPSAAMNSEEKGHFAFILQSLSKEEMPTGLVSSL